MRLFARIVALVLAGVPSGVTASLCEYGSRLGTQGGMAVAVTRARVHAGFDSEAVVKGHDAPGTNIDRSNPGAGWFGVEAKDTVGPTRDIAVEVSPLRPDCSGGHDFIESKKS
jgi:hypothetical protein